MLPSTTEASDLCSVCCVSRGSDDQLSGNQIRFHKRRDHIQMNPGCNPFYQSNEVLDWGMEQASGVSHTIKKHQSIVVQNIQKEDQGLVQLFPITVLGIGNHCSSE